MAQYDVHRNKGPLKAAIPFVVVDTVSVALGQLGSKAGSLADQGQSIAEALDELLTRSWG